MLWSVSPKTNAGFLGLEEATPPREDKALAIAPEVPAGVEPRVAYENLRAQQTLYSRTLGRAARATLSQLTGFELRQLAVVAGIAPTGGAGIRLTTASPNGDLIESANLLMYSRVPSAVELSQIEKNLAPALADPGCRGLDRVLLRGTLNHARKLALEAAWSVPDAPAKEQLIEMHRRLSGLIEEPSDERAIRWVKAHQHGVGFTEIRRRLVDEDVFGT
jgi:hypothetical protein